MKKWLSLLLPDAARPSIEIRRMTLADNLGRGRTFSLLIIIFETVMIGLNLASRGMHLLSLSAAWTYFGLYMLMLAISSLTYSLTRRYADTDQLSEILVGRLENVLLAFITAIMVWGSLISLLDQQAYGQTMVFVVNMVACATVFIISWQRMLIPFGAATLVMMAGLPFFQKNPTILLGHYINLTIFVCIAWLASRLLNAAYRRDTASRFETEATNRLLAEEIGQNQLINEKLNQVNFQLRTLSLVDDLTRTANRRGLRNFIDQVFEQSDKPIDHLSALMIDLDRFKQYNDNFGHLAGDEALTAIATVLNDVILEPWEVAARWGGEEFVVISFIRDAAETNELAEQIRQQVEALATVEQGGPLAGAMTVSIGACFQPVSKASDVGPVIAQADMAMYSAKRAGRNRVWSHPPRISVVDVTSDGQAEEVAKLAARIWREYYPPIIGEAQVEYMLEHFQSAGRIWQEIQEEQVQYDLISYQGEWAGYMAARPDPEKQAYFLSKLYIEKMYRQNSLGRILLDRLITRCREHGGTSIWLTVNKNNTASIAAYEKMGFVRSGTVVKDIGGGYVMDDYIMTLHCS
jgi:diguanylate cyclase (GGDEF)-like protein